MIVLVTGGRNYDDWRKVSDRLAPFGVGDILVVGGADGADERARQAWHYRNQLPYVVHPAPWDRTGKAAGMMRNMAMGKGLTLSPYASLEPDLVIAFPGGRGTANMVRIAEEQGIEVDRVGW